MVNLKVKIFRFNSSHSNCSYNFTSLRRVPLAGIDAFYTPLSMFFIVFRCLSFCRFLFFSSLSL